MVLAWSESIFLGIPYTPNHVFHKVDLIRGTCWWGKAIAEQNLLPWSTTRRRHLFLPWLYFVVPYHQGRPAIIIPCLSSMSDDSQLLFNLYRNGLKPESFSNHGGCNIYARMILSMIIPYETGVNCEGVLAQLIFFL